MNHLLSFLFLCVMLPLRAADLPNGTYIHEKSGLTVIIEPLRGEADKELSVVIGKQTLTVHGPAPKAGRADDILILKNATVDGTTATLSGSFTWDGKSSAVEAVVSWKDGKPELTITKNAGYDAYPAGKYPLKKRAK